MPRPSRSLRALDVARTGATNLAPVSCPPALGLTTPAFGFSLPRLDTVRKSTSFTGAGAEINNIATSLAYGGILQPRHFQGQGLKKAIETALEELAAPYEKRWYLYKRRLALAFSGDILEDGFPVYDDAGRDCDPEETKLTRAAVTFTCADWSRECFIIGRLLREFNEENPGAGRRIMSLIEAGMSVSVGAITPMTAIGIVQIHCWMGESTPSEMLDEARSNWEKGENPTDREVAAEFNIPLQEDIDQWYPEKWAYTPLYKDGFCRLTTFRTLRGRRASAICDAANALSLALARCRRRHKGRLNEHHRLDHTTEFARPVILRWSKEDRAPALYDDVMQQIASSGEDAMDLCGAILFDPGNPKACRESGERLRLMFEVTTLVDELVSLFISDEPLIHILGHELNNHGTGNFQIAQAQVPV